MTDDLEKLELTKEELIVQIKELIKTDKSDNIDINPNYLNYFDIQELNDIKIVLEKKKRDFATTNSTYLDEIYMKTKKDKI